MEFHGAHLTFKNKQFLSYKGRFSGDADFNGPIQKYSWHILKSQPRAWAHDGYVRPMEFTLQGVIAPGKGKFYGMRFVNVFRIDRLKIIACDKRGRGVEIDAR